MKLKYLLAPLVFFASVMFATASYAIGTLTGVSAPASAAQNATVTITVDGRGTCASSISYGDGTPDGSTGSSTFPHTYTHPYSSTGVKTISVSATGFGCSGSASTTINIAKRIVIVTPIKFSKIRSISGPNTARWGKSYRMKVLGDGNCKLRIDWGDGGPNYNANNYNLSAPRYLYHKYNFPGSKIIRVTPAPTRFVSLCRGSASKSVRVSIFRTAPKPAIKKAPGVRYQMK